MQETIHVAFLSRHHQITPDVDKKDMLHFLSNLRASLVSLLDKHPCSSFSMISPDRPPYEQSFMDLAYTLGGNSKVVILRKKESSSASPVVPNQQVVFIPESVAYEDYLNGLPGLTYLLHHQVQLLIPPALRRATYIKV